MLKIIMPLIFVSIALGSDTNFFREECNFLSDKFSIYVAPIELVKVEEQAWEIREYNRNIKIASACIKCSAYTTLSVFALFKLHSLGMYSYNNLKEVDFKGIPEKAESAVKAAPEKFLSWFKSKPISEVVAATAEPLTNIVDEASKKATIGNEETWTEFNSKGVWSDLNPGVGPLRKNFLELNSKITKLESKIVQVESTLANTNGAQEAGAKEIISLTEEIKKLKIANSFLRKLGFALAPTLMISSGKFISNLFNLKDIAWATSGLDSRIDNLLKSAVNLNPESVVFNTNKNTDKLSLLRGIAEARKVIAVKEETNVFGFVFQQSLNKVVKCLELLASTLIAMDYRTEAFSVISIADRTINNVNNADSNKFDFLAEVVALEASISSVISTLS